MDIGKVFSETRISNVPPELKHCGVVYSRTILATDLPEAQRKRVYLDLLHPSNFSHERDLVLGIANVRIGGNEWERAEFVHGSTILDRLYRNLGLVAFPMLENGSCVLANTPTCSLAIDGKYDSITYDVVLVDLTSAGPFFSIKGYQCDYVKSGGFLPFTFGVENLVVKSASPLSQIYIYDNRSQYETSLFCEDKGVCTTPDFPFTYTLNMNPAINFSKLDCPCISFTPSAPGIHVWVVASYFNVCEATKETFRKVFAS